MPDAVAYPRWRYFPSNERPPTWVSQLASCFAEVESSIRSEVVGPTSDEVLERVRPGLVAMGFEVEAGKGAADKVERPVLFGANGVEQVRYEIDGFHDDLGIALEVEAGRGAQSNAVERDLIRAALIVDAAFLVIAVPTHYQTASMVTPTPAYENSIRLTQAIYASGRLGLPFVGLLVLGY